jgi:hypothetical protein
MQNKLWSAIPFIVIIAFGFAAGSYGQEEFYKISRLVKLENGKAKSGVKDLEKGVVIRDSLGRKVAKAVSEGDPVELDGQVDCGPGFNAALQKSGIKAICWLNYETSVQVRKRCIKLVKGSIYVNETKGAQLGKGEVYVDEMKGEVYIDRGDESKGEGRDRLELVATEFYLVQQPDNRFYLINPAGTEFYVKSGGQESLLFDVDPQFSSDLDRAIISEDLRRIFEDNGISLSDSSTVSVENQKINWLIIDESASRTYIVRMDRDQLNVYHKEPSIVYLFKGKIDVGPLEPDNNLKLLRLDKGRLVRLDKETPVAQIYADVITPYDLDIVPGSLEDELFRAALWNDNTKSLMKPFWLKPQVYVPTIVVASSAVVGIIVRIITESRLHVRVEFP